MRVMIRGVYSTSLTKLLLDKGYEITKPSKRISERFGLELTQEPWDIMIESKPGTYGVRIYGSRKDVEKIIEDLLEVNYTTACISKLPLGATYLGEVVNTDNGKSIVDIGGRRCLLKGSFNIGEKLLVSTTTPSYWGEPILTLGVSLAGKYVLVSKSLEPSVTSKIDDKERREQLYRLARLISRSPWSVKILEPAQHADTASIIEEANILIKEAEEIDSKTPGKIGLVRNGIHVAKLNFSYASKKRLDEIRSQVLPTAIGHHYMRALGRTANVILNFAERLIEKGYNRNEISKEMLISFLTSNFEIGKRVYINHYTPDGKRIRLTPGIIININPEELKITVKRVFRRNEGIYNGIGAPKEKGDYAISSFKLGSMYYKSSYYNASGVLKGVYVNISTPLEFNWNSVEYVDLLIDVVKDYSGDVRILDMDELEKYTEEGLIPRKLSDEAVYIAKEQAEELKK